MFPTNKTEIAKLALSMVVAMKVTEVAKEQVATHTEFDADGIPVTVGCAVVGHLASNQLRPVTDNVIDFAAKRIVAFKNRNKQDIPA